MSFSKLFSVLVAKLFRFVARGEKAETLEMVEKTVLMNQVGFAACKYHVEWF